VVSKGETEISSTIPPSVIVVGGGPAGMLAAIALAAGGVRTALVAPRQPYGDNRTTALLAGSLNALKALDVWRRCEARAQPIATIRLIDDRSGLLKAPEVAFEAAEIGLPAFGHNIENRVLMAALEARAAELDNLVRIDTEALDIAISDAVAVRTSDGQMVVGSLAVGADGRNSLCRQAAGIPIQTRAYDQIAVTLTVEHARPHRGVSAEFHTDHGPFTLVPLPGYRSSLVWVSRAYEAERIAGLDGDALNREVERRSHSILGKVVVEPTRSVFPLMLQTATPLAANRIALVGEAAHVLPPIGAQGLNLGFRDAAALADCVIRAVRTGDDPGGDALIDRYNAVRQFDVRSRSIAIDWLNRSLLTDFIPAQGVRGLGLYMSSKIGPLRRALMREGVAPRAHEPPLMRGDASFI
jgi:2-octaprenyl-6-methoxyphenol hydroxylase